MGAMGSLGGLVSAFAGALTIFTAPQPGAWSSKAHYLWPGPTAIADLPAGGRHVSVAAPDGRMTLRVDDGELRPVDAADPQRFSGVVVPIESLAEVLWAPTSDVFAVTQSDGGWVGTWSVTVYRLRATGVSVSAPTKAVLADFQERFPKCPDEHPNVAAVDWEDGTRRLRLVVEMPCHSSCADMCEILGYVVDPVTGAVARRLSAAQVRTSWPTAIGPRVAEAP
jgi:hypothetical protein